MKKSLETPCPCGSTKTYAQCCGRYHGDARNITTETSETIETPPSAEALMRSRYSAYVLSLEPYLLSSWHASTRPPALDLAEDANTRWLGLDIKRHQSTGADTAIVEFVARYKIGGRAHRLHETSRFVRENGRWYYLDGEFPAKDAHA